MSGIGPVWLNGRLLPASEATLSFLTPALHYGVAVFEGIRAYATPRGPAIFRLGDHMRRLIESAHILGFRELPYTADELSDAARATVAASGLERLLHPPAHLSCRGRLEPDGRLGPAARGDRRLALERRTSGRTRWTKACARTSRRSRGCTRTSTMTKAKIAGNYVNSVLAKTESVRLGFDETIMLDPQGYVAECSGENLFVVRRGELTRRPPGAVLEGLTRDTVIQLAGDLGFDVDGTAALARCALHGRRSVRHGHGGRGHRAARDRLPGRSAPGARDPITRALQEAYRSLVAGDHPRSSEWLDYVAPAQESAIG